MSGNFTQGSAIKLHKQRELQLVAELQVSLWLRPFARLLNHTDQILGCLSILSVRLGPRESFLIHVYLCNWEQLPPAVTLIVSLYIDVSSLLWFHWLADKVQRCLRYAYCCRPRRKGNDDARKLTIVDSAG